MRRNNPDQKITGSDKKEFRSSKDSVMVYEEDDDDDENESETERENKKNTNSNTRAITKGCRKEKENCKDKENREPKQESFESDESVHLLIEEHMDFKASRENYRKETDIQDKTENELIQNLKKEAMNSFLEIKRDLLEQYLEFRNQIFKGQKSFRVVSQIATANLLLMGSLNCIFGLVSLNLLAVLISLYIMSISSVILMLELSKKKRIKRIVVFVRTWFKFLDLSAGRGFLQILLCTISLYLTQSTYFSLMSLFVGFTGLLNIIFGILAAFKLRKIINILKYYGSRDLEDLGIHDQNEISQTDLENIKINKDQDPEYKLRKIHRLFNALDEDGNGKIDRDELYDGLKSLNFPFSISKSEVEVIFDHLDKDSNNIISIQEFEHWFISKKCPYFIL
ncbi:uncharacterized protein cubi_01151 [Cryptosporidium ubiquitum]|uniref:EF-hand domain-containing protein n=1 Tax=Cryptosporidium ubiquitum TaxID=857276 RepID=A0A1J4MLH5_9CRYT|nr:uncharacterized protein cubi_01151 [Cryptosporidium ubiquitum]OII74307.1 hypothetical protein cubi_01151 [Cryptosporidium ubiquitum]